MFILKLIAKIVLLPVLIAAVLVQWIGIFLNGISSVILNILSFVIALTGIASLLFGLATGPEAVKMLAGAFIVFLIPHVGDWLIDKVILLRSLIGTFLMS